MAATAHAAGSMANDPARLVAGGTASEGYVAYGLHLVGPRLDGLLLPAHSIAPPVTAKSSPALVTASPVDAPVITVGHGEPDTRPPHLDEGSAKFDLSVGRSLFLDRHTRRATFSGPAIPPDQMAHPHLRPVGVVFNRWFGREAYHAGSFVAAGRSWLVIGPREAGKSSLLALLAARGLAVLADDLAITDGERVFTGPRCIDLRAPLPGVGHVMGRSRGDSRWRVVLPHDGAHYPLGGWVFLGWGEPIDMTPVPAQELVRQLARIRHRSQLPSNPRLLLDLAARPAWTLTRPKDWKHADATLDLLVATVTDAAGADDAVLAGCVHESR
jgi:hypothetical protein